MYTHLSPLPLSHLTKTLRVSPLFSGSPRFSILPAKKRHKRNATFKRPPQRRRHLQQLHEATRLSFVMMLVGSRRDPPVASRAIAAMLVDHWCDKEPCSFLQKVGGWMGGWVRVHSKVYQATLRHRQKVRVMAHTLLTLDRLSKPHYSTARRVPVPKRMALERSRR